MEGKSILVLLLPLSAQISIAKSDVTMKDEQAEHVVSKSKDVEPEHIIDKHKTSPFEAVVDLHIYELINDYENLESVEMLRIQVKYFTRRLENAIANKLKRVSFIHGVGTGVMKTAIKEILKTLPTLISVMHPCGRLVMGLWGG